MQNDARLDFIQDHNPKVDFEGIGFLLAVLEAYHNKRVKIQNVSQASIKVNIEKQAIVFSNQNSIFSIQASCSWHNAQGVSRILRLLDLNHSEMLLSLPKTKDYLETLNLDKKYYQINIENHRDQILVYKSPDLNLPFARSQFSSPQIKSPILILIDLEKLKENIFNLTLDLYLQIVGSDLLLKLEFISKQKKFKIIGTEKMKIDEKVRAALKIGYLEISLVELINLRNGVNISFDMPEVCEAEIEVAGNKIAKAQLIRENERFIVKIL